MPIKTLSPPFRKILVVGPIYDKQKQWNRVQDMFYKSSEYDYIIFNGGLCYPRDNQKKIVERREEMAYLINDTKKIIYVAGRLDYLLAAEPECDTDLREWIIQRPNVVIADFPSRPVLIMDGGLPKKIGRLAQLSDNLEISFVSKTDQTPWHQNYNGSLGYVISNNPLTNEHPKYYNYSMQLGTLYEEDGPVYAQEVDETGLKQTILL